MQLCLCCWLRDLVSGALTRYAQQEISSPTVLRQLLELSGAEKAVFHMCNFRSLRDLEAAQSGVGMVHWRITYGWEEARFLKRTFISFIAKLWGFWVGEYAVHNFLDFPTARKKSSACRVGKLRKKISSFKFRQHRKVLPDFSTARSPAFSTWGKVSVRDECSSKVHSFTYSHEYP